MLRQMSVLFLAAACLGSAVSGNETGVVERLINIAESRGRGWAKPIQRVDMNLMRDFFEQGLFSHHEAEWYAVIDESMNGDST